MGCGKSTLGRAVGKLTGLTFIDLDTYIENRFHITVRELFARFGEEVFRRREQAMLHEVAEFEDVIVACGGGTPCFFDNVEFMNSHGITVWLNTPLDRIYERLKRGRHKRPLLAGKTDSELLVFISAALRQREPFYSKAAYSFSARLLEDKSQIAATATEFVRQFINEPEQ